MLVLKNRAGQYHTGIYTPESRGKIPLDIEAFSTENLGLLKPSMEIPNNDIAHSIDGPLSFKKPSDQSTYDEMAYWPNLLFSKRVHPFSNSISGTFLCVLKSLAFLNKSGVIIFKNKEEFIQNIRIMIASFLYYSGGHSLFEFLYPLRLPAVIQAFEKMNIDVSDINLINVFLKNNNNAFNKALDKSIAYNHFILSKKHFTKEKGTYSLQSIESVDKSYEKIFHNINGHCLTKDYSTDVFFKKMNNDEANINGDHNSSISSLAQK